MSGYFVFKDNDVECEGKFHKIGVRYFIRSEKGEHLTSAEALERLKQGLIDKIEYDYSFLDKIKIKSIKHNLKKFTKENDLPYFEED